MQKSQVICLACRRQRALAAASRRLATIDAPRWQTRASSSVSKTDKPESERWDDDELVPSIDFLDTDEPARPQRSRFQPLPRKQTPHRIGGRRRDGENSLSIFQRVVNQQAGEEKLAEEPKQHPTGAVQFYNDLAQLGAKMKEERLEDAFGFFVTKLLQSPPFEGRNRLLKERGVFLLGQVTEAKIGDMDNKKLPSVAQLTKILHEIEALSTARWADLIMALIRRIIAIAPTRADYPSYTPYKKAMVRKQDLLDDLANSWIAFNRASLNADTSKLQSTAETKFRLPMIKKADLEVYRNGNLTSALAMMFPDHLIQSPVGCQRFPAAALATFVLMVDPVYSTGEIRRKAEPLLGRIGMILSVVTVRGTTLSSMLEPYPEVLAYVMKLWDIVTTRLRDISGNERQQQGKIFSYVTRATLGKIESIDSIGIHAQVTDAMKMGDVEMVETSWTQYWGRGPDDPARAEHLKKDGLLVFNYFILAFTALKRPQRAIDVWDAMISVGVEPTLKTWTTMMEGCRRAKNPVGLENVWKKLVASGIKLDTVVWTARIVGLIDCGEPEAGLHALSEMLKLSQEGGVPMTVESVNAAVAGLIRLNAMSAARKVLSWASENGIEPDVITYNTLLRPMVYQGNAKGVSSLLKMMEAQNIEPNGATWTILLDGIIASTKDLSREEQSRSVQELLDDIEAAGAEVNMETCARMIHLLLRDGQYSSRHTEGAVGAVFSHIRSKGLKPTVHIYTMLVDHYFSRRPPAIEEVEGLLGYRGLEYKDGRMDRVFWERLIKGYASAGHVDRAFELFTRAGHVAAWMTLATLETLLRSLVREARMAEAQSVVDKVKKRRALATTHEDVDSAATEDGGEGSAVATPPRVPEMTQRRHWRHGFWMFAIKSGLLSTSEWSVLEAGGIPPSTSGTSSSA